MKEKTISVKLNKKKAIVYIIFMRKILMFIFQKIFFICQIKSIDRECFEFF